MAYPVLYILMRTDMDSMNPGRGMAQAAHAANQFVKEATERKLDLDEWHGGEYGDGFGVTIVLGADSEYSLNTVLAEADDAGFLSGSVVDSSYRVKDGKASHMVQAVTCGFIYVRDKTTKPCKAVEALHLHK